jgi:tetratricopeptide (TPR) repeat protein/CHAT domain-containing protein
MFEKLTHCARGTARKNILTPTLVAVLLLAHVAGSSLAETVTVPAAPSTAPTPQSRDEVLADATEAVEAKDWQKALQIANRLLMRDPEDVGAIMLRGLAAAEAGRHDQALTDLTRALAIREKTLGPDHPDVASSLNTLAGLYYAQGQYAQAEPLYKRALAINEKVFGPDHLSVATGLNNLAYLSSTQGQYAQAEPLYKRSLAILEKALGPDHPNVAQSLNNLAGLYHARGRYAQAEPLYMRSLAIREKALGPDHPAVAQSLNDLAGLYRTQGHYAQAEPLYTRSLAIREKALGPDHPEVAQSLNNLALLYGNQGQHAHAEPLYKRSLAIDEKAFGPDHPEVAASLNNLADLYSTQGQHAEAEPLFKRSLAIKEKAFGPDHPDVALSLNGLAELYRIQGLYALAEPLYSRSLKIWERALGPDHPDVAASLNNLAALYSTQGRYAQAEPLHKRSLAIKEKALGPDHPDVAVSLNNLAGLYRTQGQYAQAEPLFRRSLAINEKALGPDHSSVARSLNNLAELYDAQGRYAQAEPLYMRSLAIDEKALGPHHPSVATTLNNLAGLYRRQGQHAQAEPLYKRSLAIDENALGPDHPSVGTSLNNLALLYKDQGQYAQAEPLYKRSLAIDEKALGPDHPSLAKSLNNLAVLHYEQGQYAQALSVTRRASSIYRERIVAGGASDAAVQEASKNRNAFFNHLALLSRNPGKEATDNIVDEAIQIVQLEQASGTASAIAKMAARFASGDDALAGLIKRKQDASERRARTEAQLVAAASKPPHERRLAVEKELRDENARSSQEIATIDAELTRRFPEYQELARPEPLSVGQIRALLKQGEAMLVYALGRHSYLWVIKPDRAVFLHLEAGVKEIAAKVATIRAEMDFDRAGNAVKVSVGVLHELYLSLFGPATSHLAGVQHLMVVPAGPLQSMPFGMLVAKPPPEIRSDADYRQVDWLARHYAVSVLPSVSSIQAFRQFAKASSSQEAFAGFGDPLIGGKGGATRGKRGKVDVAMAFRNPSTKGDAQASAPAMEIADVEAIRLQQRLPETADELVAMAKVLKSDQKSLWLRESATETRIKNLDLSKYRTLAFATHGVMAGEMRGVGEAGLILTPPRQGSIEDDGYLTAGEIARLKLNADWVVLSACNTAAADGTPGAEGLSGLAKAFFYAGARSLLVSHWPVASEATVPLTTGMLKEFEANPDQGKSEAHRKAMMALMATPDRPEYAHPIFWAPFVVVGEGGASGGVGGSLPGLRPQSTEAGKIAAPIEQ